MRTILTQSNLMDDDSFCENSFFNTYHLLESILLTSYLSLELNCLQLSPSAYVVRTSFVLELDHNLLALIFFACDLKKNELDS